MLPLAMTVAVTATGWNALVSVTVALVWRATTLFGRRSRMVIRAVLPTDEALAAFTTARAV